MDKNALIMEIGRLIATDPAVADRPWDGYALVASYADGARRLAGFRYRDGAAAEPATPGAGALGTRLDALRAATRVPGKDDWNACVVKLRRATGKVTVDFDYEAPERWDVTPRTLADVAERARPQ
ncbi:hypothetical protein [Coralloluteibacterium thermophilus]|uniref:DUF600 family protein n=1 Tax=Coralloluteibacterium thermophilum TaxID=2707049 RepID=A0ABV9NP64_9GAMM